MNGTSMETFAEFDARVGSHRTGGYGHGVDMYTRRGTDERVFRVKWYERSSKYPTHADYQEALRRQRAASRNGFYCPAGNEWVEKNKLFGYDEQGLAAAIAWSDFVQPLREAFWDREDD